MYYSLCFFLVEIIVHELEDIVQRAVLQLYYTIHQSEEQICISSMNHKLANRYSNKSFDRYREVEWLWTAYDIGHKSEKYLFLLLNLFIFTIKPTFLNKLLKTKLILKVIFSSSGWGKKYVFNSKEKYVSYSSPKSYTV